MTSFFNEYLTGAEREAAIIVAESDAQFAKLDVLFEAVNATLEANMLTAEAKVFAENGTYDDLTMLYKEAGNEATEKKQGILATIFEAIGKFFAKIGKFITDKFGKTGAEAVKSIKEDDIKLDKSFVDKINIFKKAWDILKGSVEKIKAGNYNGIKDVASAWGPIVTAIGSVGTGTVVVVKRKQIIEWIKWLTNEIQKKVSAAITAAKAAIGIGKVAKTVSNVAKNEPIEGTFTDKTDDNKSDENKKPNILDKGLELLKKLLAKLKEFGAWIAKYLGKLWNALPFKKKDAEQEINAEPAKLEAPTQESVSLFGVSLDDEDIYEESEISDEDFTELYDLFTDL